MGDVTSPYVLLLGTETYGFDRLTKARRAVTAAALPGDTWDIFEVQARGRERLTVLWVDAGVGPLTCG